MKTRVISTSIASFLVVFVACTETLALQLQNGANQVQREDYEPVVTDFLVRYLDDRKPTIDTQRVAGTNEPRIVKRTLDKIGGGLLLRKGNGNERSVRNLDHIGGGNLVRNIESNARFLRNLDHIGGGNLVRDLTAYKNDARRNLDHIGGGNLVRSIYESSENREEAKNAIDDGNLIELTDLANLFKSRNPADDRAARNLDQIGGGNLVRSAGTPNANLLRNLDHIGGGNLVRNLDQIGGGNLVRNADHFYE